jgi:formate-dependent nitrite reductase cytochrome c552 subunit
MFEHKGVRCVDCHMAQVPVEVASGTRMTRTHDWNVLDNLPFSCGVGGTGCHANHKVDWAVKQILKGRIHQSNENNSGGNK